MKQGIALFKKFDCILQIVLICAVPLLLVIQAFASYIPGDYIVLTYFSLGGWQLISFFIHLFWGSKPVIRLRRIYTVLLIIAVILFLLAYFIGDYIGEAFIIIGQLLLIYTTCMAILYLITCLRETWGIPKQPVDKQ